MEKTTISASAGEITQEPLTDDEIAERAAANAAFVPRVREPSIEELLVEIGLVSQVQLDEAREAVRAQLLAELSGPPA